MTSSDDATYECASVNETLVFRAPSVMRSTPARTAEDFQAINMVASLCFDPHCETFRKPTMMIERRIISDRSLADALRGPGQDTGVVVVIRTKSQKVLRAYYFEQCTVKPCPISVHADDGNPVTEFVELTYTSCQPFFKGNLPALDSFFEEPKSLLTLGVFGGVKEWQDRKQRKAVLSPRQRAAKNAKTRRHEDAEVQFAVLNETLTRQLKELTTSINSHTHPTNPCGEIPLPYPATGYVSSIH